MGTEMTESQAYIAKLEAESSRRQCKMSQEIESRTQFTLWVTDDDQIGLVIEESDIIEHNGALVPGVKLTLAKAINLSQTILEVVKSILSEDDDEEHAWESQDDDNCK